MRNEPLHDKKPKYRHNAVCKRYCRVGYRHRSEIGNEKRYDKVKGLHIAELALAHEPHYHEHEQVNNYGSDK